MSKSEWAAKEVELLCKKLEGDYAKKCASAALEAFNFITNQGHSGCSIEITKSILFDLLNGRPLTSIEGTDDEWVFAFNKKDSKVYQNLDCKVYQNLRRSSLFKTVHFDGTVEYDDIDTSYCRDKNATVTYTNTFIQRETLEALSAKGIYEYCVTFPYFPTKEKLEIVTEDCMCDKTQKGDYDTIGILYADVPERGKITINKFYKETENGFEPISKDEYDLRILLANTDS